MRTTITLDDQLEQDIKELAVGKKRHSRRLPTSCCAEVLKPGKAARLTVFLSRPKIVELKKVSMKKSSTRPTTSWKQRGNGSGVCTNNDGYPHHETSDESVKGPLSCKKMAGSSGSKGSGTGIKAS